MVHGQGERMKRRKQKEKKKGSETPARGNQRALNAVSLLRERKEGKRTASREPDTLRKGVRPGCNR